MKVTSYVYVVDKGRSVLLRPGDTVPDGVEVTNPDALDGAPEPDEKTADEPDDSEPADEPDATILPAPKKRAPAKKAQPASE